VPRRRRGSTRSRPVVRDEPESPPDAIELPGSDEPSAAEIESHSLATPVGHPKPSTAPDPDSDAISLAAAGLGFDDDSAPLNAPTSDASSLVGDPRSTMSDPRSTMSDPRSTMSDPRSTMSDPAPADPREEYFLEVYNEFVALKETCGEDVDNFPYEKFAKKLRKNTDQLMARDGIADVKFTVYIKDGKAALKAKVVKA